MTVTHGFRRTIGGISYDVDGCATAHQARKEVFRMMLKDGWQPPKLREKWWQLWRPKEYEEGLGAALEMEGK